MDRYLDYILYIGSKSFVKVLIRQQRNEQGDRVVRNGGAQCLLLGWPKGRSVRAASDLVLNLGRK